MLEGKQNDFTNMVFRHTYSNRAADGHVIRPYAGDAGQDESRWDALDDVSTHPISVLCLYRRAHRAGRDYRSKRPIISFTPPAGLLSGADRNGLYCDRVSDRLVWIYQSRECRNSEVDCRINSGGLVRMAKSVGILAYDSLRASL